MRIILDTDKKTVKSREILWRNTKRNIWLTPAATLHLKSDLKSVEIFYCTIILGVLYWRCKENNRPQGVDLVEEL